MCVCDGCVCVCVCVCDGCVQPHLVPFIVLRLSQSASLSLPTPSLKPSWKSVSLEPRTQQVGLSFGTYYCKPLMMCCVCVLTICPSHSLISGEDYSDPTAALIATYQKDIKVRIVEHLKACAGHGVIVFDEAQKAIPSVLDGTCVCVIVGEVPPAATPSPFPPPPSYLHGVLFSSLDVGNGWRTRVHQSRVYNTGLHQRCCHHHLRHWCASHAGSHCPSPRHRTDTAWVLAGKCVLLLHIRFAHTIEALLLVAPPPTASPSPVIGQTHHTSPGPPPLPHTTHRRLPAN